MHRLRSAYESLCIGEHGILAFEQEYLQSTQNLEQDFFQPSCRHPAWNGFSKECWHSSPSSVWGICQSRVSKNVSHVWHVCQVQTHKARSGLPTGLFFHILNSHPDQQWPLHSPFTGKLFQMSQDQVQMSLDQVRMLAGVTNLWSWWLV